MSEESFFKRKTIPPLFFNQPKERGDIPLPESIGSYKVENLLDKGGMSLLYLASHPDINAPITIKVLLPKFLSHPEMSARFLKEAEIIALADHPNIVKLYGYGRWEGGLYIAMEFIQGRSLRQYLAQNPLSLRTALEMVLEIAYALCHLHTHGVIHRDLKPENILINEQGHVKVIDFGIAQLIDPFELANIDESFQRRQLIGTPVYMSPEQLENPESASYPSDIYSLGIIAYELVLGKFRGGQIYLSLMPRGLEKILSKALQQQISERYNDIVDFISDLSSYLHSPQFEKEKKASDQAGELFEKLQMTQQQLIASQPIQTDHYKIGFAVHRPYGFSGILVEYSNHYRRLILGETSKSEIDSMMHILYIKGLIDGLAPGNFSLSELASHINKSMLNSPDISPFSLSLLRFNETLDTIHFLSCGYGPIWKITKGGEITVTETSNVAIGLIYEFTFKDKDLTINSGDKFILCPLSETGHFFSFQQFKQLLNDEQTLTPQIFAESIMKKAKSQYPRFFDDHPFVVAVIEIL